MRFPILIACCLAACMLICHASAETRIAIPESSFEGTANLPVIISGITAATGVSFELSYDRDIVRIESITASSEIPGSTVIANINNDAGHAKVAIPNTMGFSAMEPASLAVIRFTRVGPDGGTVFIQNPRWSDAQFIIHTFDVILNGNIVSLEAVAPVANFTANVTEGNAPLTVRFTDKSAGNVTAWSWAFGDGNISTEQHPVHTYWAPGNYIVNLTVMNNAGSNTMTRPGYISATVRGDFNKDGEVDISDVSKVAYMVVGKVAADSDADFNGNGKVDIGDAAKIAYFSVGKIEAL